MIKRPWFLAFFIGCNIAFVFLLIHKQSHFIQLSYSKQKIELENNALKQQKQKLIHHAYTLYDRKKIKEIAAEKLALQPMKVSQIKKLLAHEPSI